MLLAETLKQYENQMIMKYAKLLLAVLCTLLLGLNSCSDDKTESESPSEPFLTVGEKEFSVDADGGTFYTTVSSNREIRVEPNRTWCSAEILPDVQEKNLKIRVLPNGDEERQVTILVSAPDCESVEIVVTQAERPEGPYLSVSETKFSATAQGGTFFATLASNREVSVESDAVWCGAELLPDADADNLVLKVDPNEGPERTATVLVSAPDCDPVEITVVQERVKSKTCDLLTFSIEGSKNSLRNNITFDFDKENRTLKGMYLKWISKENPDLLVPKFTFDGVRVTVNGSPVVSGETKISFAEDVALVVEAENGDTRTYTVTLNCPQINTELPVLRMQPDYEITSKDYYVPTAIKLYSPHTAEGWWDSATKGKVEMRGRGNSTWGLPKKPYRLKFPEKFSPIGLNHTSAKSWVLLANDMDKSLLRDDLGFAISRDLFNAADGYHDPSAVLFTSCSQHINVYKNDDYLGLYQMCDQMERAKGRIEVDKLEAKDGADAEKITGGYIVETDLHEGTFNSSRGIRMSHKYPKDDDCDPAQYRYIRDFINTAEKALYGSNFKDPVNGWRRYFDEKTLADFIIVKELCGDMDGYTSTYFYKRRGVDKLFFGPIWDVDKGWDNDKRVPHTNPLTSLMIYAGFYMPSYVYPDWFHRLWEDESFRSFVAKRWAAKKPQLVATIKSKLDRMPVDMAKAIEANFTVWPFYYQYSDEAKMPAKTYPLEIERMRKLTDNRAALLDQLFNK